MMKKMLVFLLAFSALACTKVEEAQEFEYLTFYGGHTKAITVNWTLGDKISVFSLDEKDNITYIDTVELTDVNKTKAYFTAKVDKKADRYYFIYPYNALLSEVGDKIDRESYWLAITGNFEDVGVMKCEVPHHTTYLQFENAFALMKLTASKKCNVNVDSSYHCSFDAPTKGEYYIPLSYRKESIKVRIVVNGIRSYAKTFNVEPGIIYNVSL